MFITCYNHIGLVFSNAVYFFKFITVPIHTFLRSEGVDYSGNKKVNKGQNYARSNQLGLWKLYEDPVFD